MSDFVNDEKRAASVRSRMSAEAHAVADVAPTTADVEELIGMIRSGEVIWSRESEVGEVVRLRTPAPPAE